MCNYYVLVYGLSLLSAWECGANYRLPHSPLFHSALFNLPCLSQPHFNLPCYCIPTSLQYLLRNFTPNLPKHSAGHSYHGDDEVLKADVLALFSGVEIRRPAANIGQAISCYSVSQVPWIWARFRQLTGDRCRARHRWSAAIKTSLSQANSLHADNDSRQGIEPLFARWAGIRTSEELLPFYAYQESNHTEL
jgi:hypothetical protein